MARTVPARVGTWARYLGRRGAFLVIFGILFILRGEVKLQGHFTPIEQQSFGLATRIAPLEVWGWAAIVVGVVAVVSALLSHDGHGFAALQTYAGLWALAAALTWVVDGSPMAARTALSWTTTVAAIFIVSGWPEAVDLNFREIPNDE